MQLLKALFFVLIIAFIAGGGFFLWNRGQLPRWPVSHLNSEHGSVPYSGTKPAENHQTRTHGKAPLPAFVAVREALEKGIATTEEAIALITVDPYATVTAQEQTKGGTPTSSAISAGTVFIQPSGSGSVTVNPPAAARGAAGNADILTPGEGYVHSQEKLREAHEAIRSLAVGMAVLDEIKQDLATATVESMSSPLAQYSFLVSERVKLARSINLLRKASNIADINPYGQADGYRFHLDTMARLHRGIYKLAQGLALLEKVQSDLDLLAAQSAETLRQSGVSAHPLPAPLAVHKTIFEKVLYVLGIIALAGVVIGLFGTIVSMSATRRNRATDAAERS